MLFEFAQRKYSARGRIKALVVSVVLHISVIATLIAIPFLFMSKLPDAELVTFLNQPPELPPPPPPPPPPSPAQYQSKPVTTAFVVPREIPKSIPPPDTTNDAPAIDPKYAASIVGGVPGGVVGGSPLGVVGGILGEQAPLPPLPVPVEAPPPPAKAPKPIFVGGDIQASKLIHGEPAVYPDLALKEHISGIVLLRITVDEQGKVADIKIVSGNPLLTPAAVDAVRRWKYSPTLLNGHPVQVIASVAVNFQLQQ